MAVEYGFGDLCPYKEVLCKHWPLSVDSGVVFCTLHGAEWFVPDSIATLLSIPTVSIW